MRHKLSELGKLFKDRNYTYISDRTIQVNDREFNLIKKRMLEAYAKGDYFFAEPRKPDPRNNIFNNY